MGSDILPNNNNIDKWCGMFNLAYTQNTWSKYYHSAFYATLDTKLRTFQYKIIRRILPTNVQLKRFGIKHSDTCDFCHIAVETYEHLFFKCPITNKILKDLVEWMYPSLIIINELNVKCVVLGYIDIPCHKTCNIINTLFLTFKYYLYRCKCTNKVPSFRELLVEIKKSHDIEKNTTHHRSREKWKILEKKCEAI